jgi:hypothetical protein
MRSLILGAALLAVSAGTAAACVQGDVDCENMMSLGEQSHRLRLPGPPDEREQKYDAARQEFGHQHATEQATAEQQAWEKRRHPDRPPGTGKEPAADKAGRDPAGKAETPAAKTARTVFAFDRDRKPGETIYLFGHGQPPGGKGAAGPGKAPPPAE